MTDKKPFDKEHSTKIPFSELVELIGTSCDYKFCIIDENIDDELIELADQAMYLSKIGGRDTWHELVANKI